MENMKKRVLSLTLALVLALSLLPIGVLAAEETYKIGQSYDFDTNVESELPKVPGAHWEGPTTKRGEQICKLTEHAHSLDCVTEKTATKIDASVYDASNPEMFALDTYYALDCTTSTEKHFGGEEYKNCFNGLGGDWTPFAEKTTAGLIRKIDGEFCVYKSGLAGIQDAGWYQLTCTKQHGHTALCEGTLLNEPELYSVHDIGRGQNAFGSDMDVLIIGDIKAAKQAMYKSNQWPGAWYNLSCTEPTHFHQHSMENNCYKQVDTAEQMGEGGITVTTYYQCTTPAHTHGDGCYKTQYAWVLTADTAVGTHTYQVKYLYMLKNAKTGVYEPNGQSAWTIAAAVAKAPDINDIWDSTKTQTVNAISYSKGEKSQAKDDIACLAGGEFEKDTLQYTIKLYGEQQVATTGTLTIHKIVKGLDGDDAALEALKKSLTFDINGDISFAYSLSVSYDKFTDSSYTTQQLENAGTYTITETDAEVPGYTLTTSCPEDADTGKAGYQVKVEAGKSAEITITNTYEKIPETVYSLIFEAGDNGVLQGGHATNGDPDNSDFHWTLDTTTNQYNWEKANTGMGTSLKRWTFHFTKANVTENIALRSGMVAKSPTPAITANDQNNPFQGFYLMNGDHMTEIAYSPDNALFTAYTAMQAAGTDTQTYRAKYSVTTPPVNPPVDPIPPVNPPVDPIPPVNPPVDPIPPVNPPVDPIPPVNPNPPIGGDDEYEPQNPATPPVTTLPNGEVPLAPLPGELVTDLPAEETPLSNLPDEETPLADLPEEETPLADAPKTGDSFGIWAALLGISGVAMAGLTLGKRKKTEEN